MEKHFFSNLSPEQQIRSSVLKQEDSSVAIRSNYLKSQMQQTFSTFENGLTCFSLEKNISKTYIKKDRVSKPRKDVYKKIIDLLPSINVPLQNFFSL